MFLDILILSIKSVLHNKLRSSLSILWIVIWVFTIVLVNSISRWVENVITEQLKFLSVTSIFVEISDTVTSKSKLDWGDTYDVLNKSENIIWATTMELWKWNIIWNNKTEVFNIIWTTETFSSVMSLDIGMWAYFNSIDVLQNKKVVVIWDQIIEKIFRWNKNVIWKNIYVWSSKFTIVWVIENAPNIPGFDLNAAVYIPYTTSEKFVLWKTSMMALVFLAKDIDNVNNAVDDIRNILREKHKLRAWEVDDFNVYEQKTMIQAVSIMLKSISFLIIWVAWIILIVSWIWIMNVMFAWVAERTKDIWISRAIWARRKDILTQFLIESVVLTFVWWLIWVLLWEWLMILINQFSEFKLIRSNSWNLFALGFAFSIGVFFWIYPAKKATKLDIVESLK